MTVSKFEHWPASISQIFIGLLIIAWLLEPKLASMPNRLIEARINDFGSKH